MTRQTDYHGWTIPTEGETENWDEVLNEFFEEGLDQDVILADGLASRPAASEDAPTLFFATDNETFYFNDGSNWIEFLTTSYTNADARAAINTDIDHGSTAPHDYFTTSDAIDAIEQANDLTLSNDLDLDTVAGDDPSLTFAEDGTNKFELFQDVSTDEAVIYSFVMGKRVLEIRPTDEFDIRTDELQMNGTTLSQGVDTSGQVTLSSGSATVTTSVSAGTTATFQVALGPVTDDAEIEWSIRAVSGGNYQVHFHETNTTVGNPTVDYDIIRVR